MGQEFECAERTNSDRVCNLKYSTAWNLKRHVQQHHEKRMTFIECHPQHGPARQAQQRAPPPLHLPSADSVQTRCPENLAVWSATPPALSLISSSLDASSTQSHSTVSLRPNSRLPTDLALSSYPSRPSQTLQRTNPFSEITYSTGEKRQHTQVDPFDIAAMRGPTDNDWHNLTQPMATGSDKNLSSSASEDTPEGQEPRKKRHCSSTAPDTGRPGAAAYKPLMPIYDVKTSRKEMLQQRGLDWLTLEAKEKFDQKYETLLSRWGVKVGHQGTCILCPEEWRLTDPLELQERLQSKNLPSPGDPRAWHSYSDHATSLPRALAWFSQWPRTGIQLDNFIGCGPFKPMDASHLCHHEHCIVHLVYEPSPINHSRNACKERARFLRAESRDVPEHCDQHDPPCLMQVRRSEYSEICLWLTHDIIACFPYIDRSLLYPVRCPATSSRAGSLTSDASTSTIFFSYVRIGPSL